MNNARNPHSMWAERLISWCKPAGT